MPTVEAVTDAFEHAGLRFVGRNEHQMLIADNLGALEDRMAHRAISTLTPISGYETREFEVSGVDVNEVIAWARTEAQTDETRTLRGFR